MLKIKAALVAVLLLTVLACGGDDASSGDGDGGGGSGSGSTSDPSGEGDPVSGGSLTFIHQNEATRGFDPILFPGTPATESQVGIALYDVLLHVEPDGTIEPRIAESLESEDGLQWTMTLREGVTFTDGTPFDSEAVKFNWERYADPENGSPSAGAAASVESMDASDPRVLEITLVQPNTQFPRLVERSLAMIASPTAIEEEGEGFAERPVGAGPFTLKEWQRDNRTVLVKNPDYWDAPRPYLDEIIVRPVTDAQQRYDTFKAGDGDVVFSSFAQLPRQAEADGYAPLVADLSGGSMLMFNTTTPPFDDVRVRQAFSYALDVDQVVEIATGGASTGVHTLFAEGSPFYEDTSYPAHDLDKAQELIDEYVEENGGEPVDMRLTFQVSVATLGEAVQQAISQLDNVEVAIDTIEGRETTNRLVSRDFNMMFYSMDMIDPEPNMYNQMRGGLGGNFTGFDNSELNDALDEGRQSFDLDERKQAYGTAQEIITDEVPVRLLYRTTYTLVGQDTVHGIRTFNEGVADWSSVWMDG